MDADYVPPFESPSAPITSEVDSGSESHKQAASSPVVPSTSATKRSKSTVKDAAAGSASGAGTLSPQESAVCSDALRALKGGTMKNAIRFVAMRVYYSARKRGASKEAAAREAAPCMGDGTRAEHILELAGISEEQGAVALDKRTAAARPNKSRWVRALLADEETELKMELIDFVRKHTGERGKRNVRLALIQRFINTDLLAPYIASKRRGIHEISKETTRRWLRHLGFRYFRHKKAGFVDGHEFAPNVEARKAYLHEMREIDDANAAALKANAALDDEIAAKKKHIGDLQEGTHAHVRRRADGSQQEVLTVTKSPPVSARFAIFAESATRTRSL